jgi:membrane protease subunit (stomatin/prohibitin family)
MIGMLLMNTGAIVGIVVGCVVVIALLVVLGLVIMKHKKTTQNFIEFDGDNTSLLKVVDVGDKLPPSSTLIVPPTHAAILIRNGTIVNIYYEGEYPLYEGESKLNDKVKNIRSLKVIYISITAKITVQWGTKQHQRIEYIDPKIGKPVSVGVFGIMDVRVKNPKKFYLELVANHGQVFSVNDLQERIRTYTVDDTIRAIGKVLNEQKLSYVDFASAKYDIQTNVGKLISDKFADEFGFEVCEFIIENINIPQEQEEEIKQIYAEDSSFDRDKVYFERKQAVEEREHLAERKRKEAERDDLELDDFLYQSKLKREREQQEYDKKNRHEEEDRAWAREDKKLETEERVQNKYFDTYKDVEVSRSQAIKDMEVKNIKDLGHHCSVCGGAYKPGAKFCPDCGATLPREDEEIICPTCSMKVPWGTKFCPYCGYKFEK